MENLMQMSLLEVAISLMEQKRAPQSIRTLIKETLEMKGIEDPDGEYATSLYTDITTSSKFVYMGDEEWDLKSRQSLEEYDKDGSAFNSKDDEEDEDLLEQTNLDDEDEDEEEIDEDDDEYEDEYDHEEDEEYEEEDEYEESLDDEDEEDDSIIDDDLVQRYDEEDEDFNEDKYNDLMDDYEDMYEE